MLGISGPELLSPQSFVEVTGNVSTVPGFLQDLTGVSLRPLDATEALLRIDTTGIRLTGSTASSVHPAVEIGGEMTVDALIDAAQPETSVVELLGTAAIGEVALAGDTLLRLSAEGLVASGTVTTPLGGIGLRGSIADDGVDLRGTARVEADVADVAGLLDSSPRTLAEAQAAVDAIDAEIARTRPDVLEERRLLLEQAEGAVDDARSALDRVVGEVDAVRSDLDETRADLEAVVADILGRFPLIDDIEEVVETLIPVRQRNERDRIERWMGDLEDELSGLLYLRRSAETALNRAADELETLTKDVIDASVDLDPRIVALVASREALTLMLDAATAVASILTADAGVALAIDVALGTDGLSGAAAGAVCAGGDCLPVAGGSVSFGASPEARFTVAGTQGCLPF